MIPQKRSCLPFQSSGKSDQIMSHIGRSKEKHIDAIRQKYAKKY